MLYMVINRTRAGLCAEDFSRLARLAEEFYRNIPAGVRLHGDWAAADGSRTFALLESEDAGLLEKIQAPFAPYVEMETIPVSPVSGWTVGG